MVESVAKHCHCQCRWCDNKSDTHSSALPHSVVCIWFSVRRIPHSNLQTMRIMFACVYGIRVSFSLYFHPFHLSPHYFAGVLSFVLESCARQTLKLSVWANDNNNNHRMRPCKIRSATLTIEMWAVPHMTRSHSVLIVCLSNTIVRIQSSKWANDTTHWLCMQQLHTLFQYICWTVVTRFLFMQSIQSDWKQCDTKHRKLHRLQLCDYFLCVSHFAWRVYFCLSLCVWAFSVSQNKLLCEKLRPKFRMIFLVGLAAMGFQYFFCVSFDKRIMSPKSK